MEKPKSYVRLLFLDFSSTFNTIQPHLMLKKLMEKDVNSYVTRWIFSFLTNRPQRVRISNSTSEVLSNEIRTNTGAPQGCVLSPALFTIYTSDCRCGAEGLPQVKFSDDTSLSGMITKEENAYSTAVQKLVEWCDENILLLNISKTKELVIDSGRNASSPVPLQIKGQQVESVHQYKYLGTIPDDKLDWAENSTILLRKWNQRLYFLKRLKSFRVKPNLLKAFYQATIESIIWYNSLCFYNSLRIVDAAKLRRVVKTASRLIGSEVTDCDTHYARKVLRRLQAVLADETHPLNDELKAQTSIREVSDRLLSLKTRTSTYHKSFLPTAMRLYNNHLSV